jgi:hypothetical protein
LGKALPELSKIKDAEKVLTAIAKVPNFAAVLPELSSVKNIGSILDNLAQVPNID